MATREMITATLCSVNRRIVERVIVTDTGFEAALERLARKCGGKGWRRESGLSAYNYGGFYGYTVTRSAKSGAYSTDGYRWRVEWTPTES